MANTVLLIDADILAYQAAAGVETILCFDDDRESDLGEHCIPYANVNDAYGAFLDKLGSIILKLKVKDYILAFSDDKNFRKTLYPAYKSNRDPRRKPICLEALKRLIASKAHHKFFKRPWLEADDILGILATSNKQIKNKEKIVVTIDKDLLGVPCKYYNFNTEQMTIVSEESADRWHMFQTLIGDSSDGYPGCWGVGKKKAEKALEGLTGYKEMWPKVVEVFEQSGVAFSEALIQAQIARICRVQNYDMKNKKVKPWNQK